MESDGWKGDKHARLLKCSIQTLDKCHIDLLCQASILRIHFRFVLFIHSAVISTQIIAVALLLSRMMCVQSLMLEGCFHTH